MSEGVAVGALVCRKRLVQTVIKELDERQWRKKRVKVTPFDEERMVVAVVPEGARALDAHAARPEDEEESVPPTLARLLSGGEVAWMSGLRAGAAEATGRATAAVAAGEVAEPAFRFAELFAGMGGFRLGLEPLGGRCVFASEIEPFAAATYERNFGEAPFGDIVEVPTEAVPAHDILTAGFPCQSFSRAGAQRGLQDSRGDLFFEIVRLARARKPAALLLENVPNLLRVDNGHAMHVIARELTAIGYHVRVQLLNAAAVVPQHRERLFIVGFRDARAAAAFAWPTFADTSSSAASAAADGGAAAPTAPAAPAAPAAPPVPSLRAVLEPLDEAALRRYRLSATQWAQVRGSRDFRAQPQWRLAQLGGAARTLRGSYRKSYSRLSEFVPLRDGAPVEGQSPLVGPAGQPTGPSYAAADDEADDDEAEAAEAEAAAEVEAGAEAEAEAEAAGATAVDAAADAEAAAAASAADAMEAPRFYTERECARLQGFPDWFALEGGKLYVQLGNAVCPLLVRAVAERLLAALAAAASPSQPPAAAGEPGGGADGAVAVAAAAEKATEVPAGHLRCECFLSVAAINLLRGVTPPHNYAAVEAAAAEPGGALSEDYGRYGAEEPAERYSRVLNRPADALFEMESVRTYSLTAQPDSE